MTRRLRVVFRMPSVINTILCEAYITKREYKKKTEANPTLVIFARRCILNDRRHLNYLKRCVFATTKLRIKKDRFWMNVYTARLKRSRNKHYGYRNFAFNAQARESLWSRRVSPIYKVCFSSNSSRENKREKKAKVTRAPNDSTFRPCVHARDTSEVRTCIYAHTRAPFSSRSA